LVDYEIVPGDATGAVGFTLDLATPHAVFVQDTSATLIVSSSSCPAGWSCLPAGGPFTTAIARRIA